MTLFNGQTAIVTGATKGIGKAIAVQFLKAGAQVIGTYSSDETAAELFFAEQESYSSKLQLMRCNVADAVSVSSLFQHIEKKYETIEILVNNAGIRKDAIVAMMSKEQWDDVLDVNLTGCFLMIRNSIMLMMKKKYGRIINITSPVARLGFAGQANYAASKAGQIAMTKSLAKEVAKKKITVNCVSPGFIETDFIRDLAQETLAGYKKMIPVRRFGTPEEVAHAVMFLAHPDSSYITGTVLEISGGL